MRRETRSTYRGKNSCIFIHFAPPIHIMGVHGLWRLIEPSGKPVPLETLENKVLAVDVSIWLHQAIKGFQDSRGASVPNAHLLGIYHRICKLLYFKIKPVFVFDGGVPVLKQQTIAKRNQYKARNQNDANKIQEQLISTLLKHSAISKVLSDKAKAALEAKTNTKKSPIKNRNERENMYILPATEMDSTLSSSSSDDEDYTTTETTDSSPNKQFDLYTIETKSKHFKALPATVRHEILTDLKETRKQSSWGRLHELPSQSNDFSSFQMQRLLKRQEVQAALEEAEKEMGGHSLSLGELEKILNDQGVITSEVVGKRIASDENTRFLFIKSMKQAIEEAKNSHVKIVEEQEEESSKDDCKSNEQECSDKEPTNADLEYESDLKLAIALSLQNEPSTSSVEQAKKNLQFSFLDENLDSDDGSDDFQEVQPKTTLTSAQNYMKEYSGLTPNEIDKIINSKSENVKTIKMSKVDEPKKIVKIVEPIVSEDSDSDFVDVPEDVPAAVINGKSQPMEIVVNPGENLEDDLFSDIFESKKPETEEDKVVIQSNKANVESQEEIEPKKPNIVENNEVKDTSIIAIQVQSTHQIVPKVYSEPDIPKKDIETTENQLISHNALTPASESKQTPMETNNPTPLTVQQLTEMKENLRTEQIDLLVERSNKERLATNITDQMYQEAQDLLELFGVPYVIAPMEAEAQCAFLDEINLTDGTITDDSDVWLFGGKTVYKNFFNQAKQVMEFKAENIKHHFKLSREQMILFALLVGSDYTTGLQGVGPVTALEILAAFPPSALNEISLTQNQLVSGLREFQMWFKKGKGKPRNSLKSKLKNLQISDSFPSLQVVQAYLEPKVETSKDEFSWGKPDVVGLIEFAREKFGWTRKKTEEILNPVLKKLLENTSQKTIKDYFKTQFVVQPALAEGKVSKRVKTALDRFGKDSGDEEELGGKDKCTKKTRARKQKKETEAESPSKKMKKVTAKAKIPEGEEIKELQEIAQSDLNEQLNQASTSVVKKGRKGAKRAPTSIPKDGVVIKNNDTKRLRKSKNSLAIPEELKDDEEVKQLQQVSQLSTSKVQEISYNLQSVLDKQLNQEKPKELEMKKEIVARRIRSMHMKEVIYQKKMDKSQMLKAKMKAIEVFRRSKQGPGFVKKNERKMLLPKEDAGLSESSSDSDCA